MAVVKFEDVATRVNTKEDRHNTDLVYYVGGDHIDSESLKVSKRGIIKGAPLGPMFYFGFKPGDILFVTRNPHLRKCAVVDFAGICSEKTLVIATKDETVLCQKYLAGVMQSDDFWDFLEENKSGSVNYFINWSTLAEYEFDLPPIEEQRALAEKLWAANDLKEKYRHLLAATDEMLKAKFREMFGEPSCNVNGYPVRRLSELMQIERGGSPRPIGDYLTNQQDGVNWIKIGDVTAEDIYITHTAEKILKSGVSKSRHVFPGDFLLSNSMSFGRPYILKIDGYIHDGWLVLHDTNNTFNQIYLYSALSCEYSYRSFSAAASGSCVKNLNKDLAGMLKIVVPPRDRQNEYANLFDAAEASKEELKKSITSIDAVMRGLING